MRPRTFAIFATLALLAGACGDSTPGASIEGSWVLVSGMLDGEVIDPVDGYPITLVLDGSAASGRAACNLYGGSYTFSGSRFELGPEMGMTAMACPQPGVMEIEDLFTSALAEVDRAMVEGDRLELGGDGVALVFAAMPPVPTAELTGTVWVLESLVNGDTVSSVGGDRATLELYTDGSFLGSTGCRTLHGRYTVNGPSVDFIELSAEGECSAGLTAQDGQVVSVLGDGFRVDVDGNQLIVTSMGNEGLVYRAEP